MRKGKDEGSHSRPEVSDGSLEDGDSIEASHREYRGGSDDLSASKTRSLRLEGPTTGVESPEKDSTEARKKESTKTEMLFSFDLERCHGP